MEEQQVQIVVNVHFHVLENLFEGTYLLYLLL